MPKRGEDGYMPLHAAGCNGHYGMLRELVEAGADLSARTRTGLGVVHGGAGNGQDEDRYTAYAVYRVLL